MKRIAAALVTVAALLAAGAAVAPAPAASATLPVVTAGKVTTVSLAAGRTYAPYLFVPTRSATYLITLGRLPRNLTLTLIGPSGTVLRQSSRPGIQAERIVVPMTKGTRYRLRVSGPASSQPTVASITATSLKAGVRIVDRARVQAYSTTYPNSSDLVGQLVNNTPRWVEVDPFRFTFRSKKGAVLPNRSLLRQTRWVMAPYSLQAFSVGYTPVGWYSATLSAPITWDRSPRRKAPAGSYTVTVTDSPIGGTEYAVTGLTSRSLSGLARWVDYGAMGQVLNVHADVWGGSNYIYVTGRTTNAGTQLGGFQQTYQKVAWTERTVDMYVG
jgi:hypothetical protein